MFGFSRRHMKLGSRLKVQLSDTTQGTRSPIRHHKRNANSNGDGVAGKNGYSEEIDCQFPSAALEMRTCALGSSDNWMVCSIAGDKPTPRSYVMKTFSWCEIVGKRFPICHVHMDGTTVEVDV